MSNTIPSPVRPVVWGLIGTGFIATHFARDMAFCPSARLAAVCSRDTTKAAAFQKKFGLERSYSDTGAMADDPDIEAVIIASPNTMHFEQALLMMEAGKHVLVEKPITLSVDQAATLADLAAKKGLFAMEGMWTVFLPAIPQVRALLAQNAIGPIRHVRAELGYRKTYDPQSRFFSKDLGGGALFDLGIYPLAIAHTLFGPARQATGTWRPAPSGVDISADISLDYGTFRADVTCSFSHDGANQFVIEGDKGTIVIAAPFMSAQHVFVTRNAFAASLVRRSGEGRLQRGLAMVATRGLVPGLSAIATSRQGYGLSHEIDAASAAIRQGLTQEPSMPLAASMAVLSIIEKVRQTSPS